MAKIKLNISETTLKVNEQLIPSKRLTEFLFV